ncbi:MAG: PQQ-binding-like beta-propeller repeat protein [Bdellovibrio sp.]|nr:PQQ-binding-like beta-propeller repeat protein [Bdellovibrio sp.]
MKFLLGLIFLSITGHGFTATTEVRSQIGPLINPPVVSGKDLYLLATTGVLYQTDPLITKTKVLFQTKINSICPLTLKDSVLYFGEGLHDDIKTEFYAYDLKEQKLKFSLPQEGHIERAPLVTAEKIFVGLGPGGIAAIDLKSQKVLWSKKKIEEGDLHIDSTPVSYKNMICIASVYTYKGVVCLNEKNGEKVFAVALDKNPKSEIRLSGNLLFGMSTEATIMDNNWKTPSSLYVIDLDKNKKTVDISLRGYNFFAPTLTSAQEVFLGLSTGDMILVNLTNGGITFIGEMKAPIASTPFIRHGFYCATSIEGRLRCYQRGKDEFKLAEEQELQEVITGVVSSINGNFYIPTRTGHRLLQ